MYLPTQYIIGTFKISLAGFLAVSLVQQMPSTFTVYQAV